MASQLEQHLAALRTSDGKQHLRDLARGIEKESLRVRPDGNLSQAPHPIGLGSALTHPLITTAPLLPIATSRVAVQVTAFKSLPVKGVCDVHATPSGLVRMVPRAPTATSWEPVQATP